MLYVSSGLGSEFGQPLSLPLLSVGPRKSQGQPTFKEWVNRLHLWREELEAHIAKWIQGRMKNWKIFVIHIVHLPKELHNPVEFHSSCVSNMGLHFIMVTLLIMYFFNYIES